MAVWGPIRILEIEENQGCREGKPGALGDVLRGEKLSSGGAPGEQEDRDAGGGEGSLARARESYMLLGAGVAGRGFGSRVGVRTASWGPRAGDFMCAPEGGTRCG